MKAEPRLLGNDLIPLVYTQLRQIARIRLARLPPGQTLQPTDLVHEVYAHLVKNGDVVWESRAHYFGVAARAMRQILVIQARRKFALKRGGGVTRITLTSALHTSDGLASDEEILAVHEALERLQRHHPRKVEVVLLRYFAGLTMEQIAELNAVNVRTVERDWKFARVWLQRQLGTEA